MDLVALITTNHREFPDLSQQKQILDGLSGVRGGLPSDVLYDCGIIGGD